MAAGNPTRTSSEYKNIKRKFYHSFMKFFSMDDEEEQQPNPPDVGDLVNLLRCLGFKVRFFDQTQLNQSLTSTASMGSETTKNSECTVVVTCKNSGLRAVLESVVGECRCPTTETASQAEYWQVSGSAPAVTRGSQESLSSVQEAGSTLIPPLSVPMSNVIKSVMSRVMQLSLDTKVCDLDTSRHSFSGATSSQLRDTFVPLQYSSMDVLPLPYATKSHENLTEIAVHDEVNRAVYRTVSSMELSTDLKSPESSGKWIKKDVSKQLSSSSLLTESMEELNFSCRESLFYRLERAKRSIEDVMSFLGSEESTTSEKLDHKTSTPTPSRKTGTIRKTPMPKKKAEPPVHLKVTKSPAISSPACKSTRAMLRTSSVRSIGPGSKLPVSVTPSPLTPARKRATTASHLVLPTQPRTPRPAVLNTPQPASNISSESTSSTKTEKLMKVMKKVSRLSGTPKSQKKE